MTATPAPAAAGSRALPIRVVESDLSYRCKYCDCDDSCRYRDGLQETADEVGRRLGLDQYAIAWQSAGRTDDPQRFRRAAIELKRDPGQAAAIRQRLGEQDFLRAKGILRDDPADEPAPERR